MADNGKAKSLESWIWDAACSIRGAKDAPKYKDYILPLIFTKRLCDVFDDELNRIATEVGSRAKAFRLVKYDKKLVRFYLPLEPKDPEESVWSVIRTLSDKIGETLTSYLRDIAAENPLLKGIIDRVDYNGTTHGVRDLDDAHLSNLIESISAKRLGLNDVEPDIIGRSYEYLIRKFAEGSGQSAGEFYTPAEVGLVMARMMAPEEGMEIYDPCCGSAGLLIKCRIVFEEIMKAQGRKAANPVKLFGQEAIPTTWAMANMNMIIHDMEGHVEIGDTFRNPKLRRQNRLWTFARVVANPMWNQTEFTPADYDADELDRFPKDAGYPGSKADWGWMQHVLASLKTTGKAAVVLGTGSGSRGSGEEDNSSEKRVRKYFVEKDLIEAVILLPFNLFYNTDAPGLIYVINKAKPANRQGKVLFINAADGFEKGKPKNILSGPAAEAIVSVYHSFREEEGFSRVIDNAEIARRDYYLTPSRYVLKRARLDVVDRSTATAVFSSAVRAASQELTAVATLFESLRGTTSTNRSIESVFGDIRETCELKPLSLFVKEVKQRARTQSLPVLSCSKVFGLVLQQDKFKHNIASADLTNYKVVQPGVFAFDPMLLWDGSIGRNGYSFAGVVSPAYTVFEVRGDIDPNYLLFVLKSPMMLPHYVSISDGTNMRRRKAKFSDFAKLQIPVPPKDTQQAIAGATSLAGTLNEVLKAVQLLKDAVFYEYVFGAGEEG